MLTQARDRSANPFEAGSVRHAAIVSAPKQRGWGNHRLWPEEHCRRFAGAARGRQVLKPRGMWLSSTLTGRSAPFGREMFLGVLWNAGRFCGWLWHREPVTYGYIAPSIRRYLTIPELEKQLTDAGFKIEWRAVAPGRSDWIYIAPRSPTPAQNAARPLTWSHSLNVV